METSQPHVRTEVHSQFWRKSEERWVDSVNLRSWGAQKDEPSVWRHRVTTITTVVGDWHDGKRPKPSAESPESVKRESITFEEVHLGNHAYAMKCSRCHGLVMRISKVFLDEHTAWHEEMGH